MLAVILYMYTLLMRQLMYYCKLCADNDACSGIYIYASDTFTYVVNTKHVMLG